jgi:hypothetical protein
MNVPSRNYCWSNKFSNLAHDTQKDVNKDGSTDHKERNSTTQLARKLNGAHHGVKPLVEI